MFQADDVQGRGEAPASPEKPALPRRVVWLFVAVALLRGIVYAAVIPPWQSPDEHGHFEYAALMAQIGRVPGSGDISPLLQQEIMRSMRATRMWHLAFHHPTPPETVNSFAVDRDLAQSGQQVGNEPPLYYTFTALAYLLVRHEPIEIQLYAMRLVSVVMTAIVVALVAQAAREIFPRRLDLQLLIPSLVGLHPMLGYIGASVNNDILGTLLASLFFWVLIRMTRYGVHWRRLATLLVVALLNLVTAPQCFFILPVILITALGTLLWRRRSQRIWVGLAIGMAAIAVLTVVLAVIPTQAAQGWIVQPYLRLAGTTAMAARSGDRALILDNTSSTSSVELVGRASEHLSLLRGQPIRASAYVRTESGVVEGDLFVRDESGMTSVPFTADEAWTKVTITYNVPLQARFFSIGLLVGPAEETLYADDLSLVLIEDQEENLLFNSGGELTTSLLDRLLADQAYLRLGLPWNFHDTLLSTSNLSRENLHWYRQSLEMLFRTFWGTFIYLAVPLPGIWYRVIAAAILLASVGWVWLGLSVLRRRSIADLAMWQWFALLLMGLSAVLDGTLILLTILRPDRFWQPQGRYLFPLMLPLAVFLALGWQSLVPPRLHRCSAALVIGLMFVYDVACCFYLIAPYCYTLG